MTPRHRLDLRVLLARLLAGLLALAAMFQAGGAGLPLLALLAPHRQGMVIAIAGFVLAFLPEVTKQAGVLRAVPPSPPDVPLATPVPETKEGS